MPILPPSQMGLALNVNMDISAQPKDGPALPDGRPGPVNMPNVMAGNMNGNMFLRLSNPELLESQAELSSAHIRQMHKMMDASSGDVMRLPPNGGLPHPASENQTISNNSDLLKAFTTMSAEQQTALLSNINTKLMHSGGSLGQVQDRRQPASHSMNNAFLSASQVPFPDGVLPVDVPPPPVPSDSAQLAAAHLHSSCGAFTPAGQVGFVQYSKDHSFGSLFGQSSHERQSLQPAAIDHKRMSSSIMVDIDVRGELLACAVMQDCPAEFRLKKKKHSDACHIMGADACMLVPSVLAALHIPQIVHAHACAWMQCLSRQVFSILVQLYPLARKNGAILFSTHVAGFQQVQMPSWMTRRLHHRQRSRDLLRMVSALTCARER